MACSGLRPSALVAKNQNCWDLAGLIQDLDLKTVGVLLQIAAAPMSVDKQQGRAAVEFHTWQLLKKQQAKLNGMPADKSDATGGYVYFLRFAHRLLREAIDAMEYCPPNKRGCRADMKTWDKESKKWVPRFVTGDQGEEVERKHPPEFAS